MIAGACRGQLRESSGHGAWPGPGIALVGSSTVFAVGLAASLVVPGRAKTLDVDPPG